MSFTVEDIRKLRELSGVGMGKCKKFLEKADGDVELALTHLRASGLSVAKNKEGREANEGMIVSAENDDRVVFVEVNAETDFVVKSEKFQEFAKNVSEECLQFNSSSLEELLQKKYSRDPSLTIDQYRILMVQEIGENIQVSRCISVEKEKNRVVVFYNHMKGKAASLVEISGSDEEEQLAKEIAIHIIAAQPEYLLPENVPDEVRKKEEMIAREQIRNKPEHMIEKIVEGKIRSFCQDHCLLMQSYIKDPVKTIADLIKEREKVSGKSLQLTRYLLWQRGMIVFPK